jgi:HSP20 family protein
MFGLTPYEQRKNQVVTRRPRDIFDAFFGDDFLAPFSNGFPTNFYADIKDLGDMYQIEAEMPGLAKEDIKLDLNDSILTISAEKKEEVKDDRGSYIRRERRFGSFTRSFQIEDVKHNEINAKYENGVLIITLPKKDSTVEQRKTISIE